MDEPIDLISAWCDRWCEHCAFTTRCSAFRITAAIAMCGNADDGLELALGAPGLPEPHDSGNIAERGLFEIAISVSEHWVHIERLFTK
jgi:hypothetical protein